MENESTISVGWMTNFTRSFLSLRKNKIVGENTALEHIKNTLRTQNGWGEGWGKKLLLVVNIFHCMREA